jgi:hypothetical protein
MDDTVRMRAVLAYAVFLNDVTGKQGFIAFITRIHHKYSACVFVCGMCAFMLSWLSCLSSFPCNPYLHTLTCTHTHLHIHMHAHTFTHSHARTHTHLRIHTHRSFQGSHRVRNGRRGCHGAPLTHQRPRAWHSQQAASKTKRVAGTRDCKRGRHPVV